VSDKKNNLVRHCGNCEDSLERERESWGKGGEDLVIVDLQQ